MRLDEGVSLVTITRADKEPDAAPEEGEPQEGENSSPSETEKAPEAGDAGAQEPARQARRISKNIKRLNGFF